MGKYRRYKNRLEMFLSSERGKRVLNFLYSWGASIVILGALFKLLHIPYANQILFVAMITESIVFFISAFEHPNKEYHWEDVFPVLKSKNPMDRPDFTGTPISTMINSTDNVEDDEIAGGINIGSVASKANAQRGGSLNIAGNLDVTEEDTKNLSESIKKLSGAAEQISKMAELTEATQKYLEQLSGMSENMERFSQVTNSLTNVSDTLLNSYKSITDNSDGINQNSRGYVHQMEQLNRNVSGLNTIYEIQLKSISSQIESIEHINSGLNRIREMYDGSVVDSSVFRNETEKMTRQLAELNQVYSRLLQAMTVNMGYQQPAQPQQQPQQPMYQQPQQPVVPQPQDTLLHPLLMRNGDSRPLHKPTTPLPSLDLLTPPPSEVEPVDTFALEQMARLVEARLADFRIKADVVNYSPGPVITRFELNLAPGVKAARISNLSRDLARSLSTVAVRVVEVIPGKPYVGLELPNKKRQTVYLREVLDNAKFRDNPSPLTVVLGKDIAGEPVVADLAKMPHLLVAGTTGSGKSVGVNAMILSMLYKAQPEDVRFIMIDPKMLELSVYEGIPHLLTEVVTDMKDAANALRWCVNEMERRYKLMSALGVRNLAGYNEKIAEADRMMRPIPDPYWKPGDSMDAQHPVLKKEPYIVVLVDEFADLMMTVGKKVEELIARLAQKARAAGIHLVLATQRPSVDVITGLIKANIPTRIAFTVSSKIDSRTILDQAGAESLLGMGDMLYSGPNSTLPVRVHGAFVRDQEVHAVVQDWKARGRPQYVDGITSDSDSEGGAGGFDGAEELDPLFDQAVQFVTEKRKASISGVQRQFRIGYNRAARIIEQMEAQGIVSEQGHNGNREVLAPPPFD